MANALLILPHFWDPVCVPLGISAVSSYAKMHGHSVAICDLNTVPRIFGLQRRYFQEGKRQFAWWKEWNIERNGTEMLSLHQLLYLNARKHPRYRDMVIEVLNLDGRGDVGDCCDIEPFDQLFEELYYAVREVVSQQLQKYKPDVVGCSLFNSTWPGALYTLRLAKENNPRVRTVLGGPGPLMGITSDTAEVSTFFAQNTFVDYLVLGEGEQLFLQILEDREVSRRISTGGHLKRLSEIPTPDYGELMPDRYLNLSIASSRGCPFECSFCAETVFWNGFRSINAARALSHMEALATRYKRFNFYLCDSLANPIISELTKAIALEERPFQLDCYLRADRTCSAIERVQSWRKGGLVRARLGLESGSERILNAMHKETTVELMETSLAHLAGTGIMTSALWIIGYTGETATDFQETLKFIKRNRGNLYQCDAWVFQFHPEGLAGSKDLIKGATYRPRFSAELNEIFAVKPYCVSTEIKADERFARLEEFVRTMREFAIPNPYSFFEWISAECRWRELGHSNQWSLATSMVAMNA